jgi:hypothetical protein
MAAAILTNGVVIPDLGSVMGLPVETIRLLSSSGVKNLPVIFLK